MKKLKIFESKINESIKSINDYKVGDTVRTTDHDRLIIRTMDDIGVGLSKEPTGYIMVSMTNDKFLESIIDEPVNENANDFTANDIAEIITNINSKNAEITSDQLTPQLVQKFNTEFNKLMDKYPDYNPYDDNQDGADYEWNIGISDEIIDIIQNKPINESETDKSKEIKDVIASTTPDREDKLKELNQYFVDLQNKGALTPSEENQWKQVSKALFGKVNESFDHTFFDDYALDGTERQLIMDVKNGVKPLVELTDLHDNSSNIDQKARDYILPFINGKVNESSDITIEQRLEKLSLTQLINLCNNYEYGQRILDTCESQDEIEDCLILAFKDGLLTEQELVNIENGESINEEDNEDIIED